MFLHQYILCDSVLFDHYVASVVSQGLLCAIFAFYVAVSKIDAGSTRGTALFAAVHAHI